MVHYYVSLHLCDFLAFTIWLQDGYHSSKYHISICGKKTWQRTCASFTPIEEKIFFLKCPRFLCIYFMVRTVPSAQIVVAGDTRKVSMSFKCSMVKEQMREEY